MVRTDAPRPEHRSIDPYAADVVDLKRDEGPADMKMVLRCTECRPYKTHPVRKKGDPDSIVRCAACGKKHSTDSLTVESP